MKLPANRCPRRGVTALEFALVAPVLFMLIYGMFIAGLEVFRYQQMSSLARDCARYACVHGGKWAADKNNGTLLGTNDIIANAAGTRKFLLDLTTLENNSTITWDDSGQTPVTTSGTTWNRVHVTLKYPLATEYIPFVGSIFQNVTLQSTAEKEMMY